MTSAAEIINALGGDPVTGMCRCPAHEDKKPSLHVSEGRNGKTLVHCYAGCASVDVIAALKSRRLWSGDGKQSKPKRGRERSPSPALNDYVRFRKAFAIQRAAKKADAGPPSEYLRTRGIEKCPPNVMLLPAKESERHTGKRYPAMVAPITDGEWLMGTHLTWLNKKENGKLAVHNGKPRRMYGKAKGGYVQLAEIDAAKPLVIGEGIETTLSAMRLSGHAGVAALSSTGMEAIIPPDCSKVVIAADNDDAGRRAAAMLAERLEYEGCRVQIVTPRRKEDWNDVLVGRNQKEAKLEWEAASKRKNRRAQTAIYHSVEDFMKLTFPKREMLMSQWLPQPGIAMIFARAGHAKTYLALSIAYAVARGEDLMGWKCERPGRVLYIDGEMPGGYLKERLAMYGKAPKGTIVIVCRDTFNLQRKMMPDLGTPEGRRVIDGIIKKVKPDLIILDSLTTLVRTGEESSAEDWLPVQDWLMKHRWRGRSMLVIHHAGKSGDQRGTSKRMDTPETVIKLTKRTDVEMEEDESAFELMFGKGRELFGGAEEPMMLRLSIKKGRVAWTHTLVRNEMRERIREMLDGGMKGTAIAKEFKISPARVSQIKKEIAQEGNIVPFHNKGERGRGKKIKD